MRHVLKPPTVPRGLFIAVEVFAGMDFAHQAQVHWMPPASTGQTNITHYLMSRDDGLTWKKVPGGGLVNSTTIWGLQRGQKVQVTLRAVNKVGPGPITKTSSYNRDSITYAQKKQADGASPMDWPMPLAKPLTTRPQMTRSQMAVAAATAAATVAAAATAAAAVAAAAAVPGSGCRKKKLAVAAAAAAGLATY